MYSVFFECLGQLIVVPFLFYSGYGISERIKEDPKYLSNFVVHRILPLYLNFLVALMFYICIWAVFDGTITPYVLLKGFCLQYSFGNPTWFLFCTFYCYISTLFIFLSCNRRMYRAIFLMLSCGVYVCCMKHRPSFWYNTIFSYAFGAFVSLYKEEICVMVKAINKHCIWRIVNFTLFLLLLIALKAFPYEMLGIRENLSGLAFISVLVFVTCKFEIGNKVVSWLGRHVFPIYMYHLLFFFLAKNLLPKPISCLKAHLAVIVCFGMTCMTAYLSNFGTYAL